MSNIRIRKYRTIACIYPHCSFEVEVSVGDRIVYCNFDVENNILKVLPLDFEPAYRLDWWHYSKPLHLVDVDLDIVDLSDNEAMDIYEQMVRLWNHNPVWDNNSDWKILSEDCASMKKDSCCEDTEPELFGFIFRQGTDDFTLCEVELSKDDMDTINSILEKYDNDGVSVRGDKTISIADLAMVM